MTTNYVIDASAGVELLLDTARARALLPKLHSGAQWWAPEHYFAEVASVLRRGELSGSIPSVKAAVAFRSLVNTPIRRVQVRPLLTEAWASRDHITVYDALYVVLARHLNTPLVTADLRLAGAPQLSVEVITP